MGYCNAALKTHPNILNMFLAGCRIYVGLNILWRRIVGILGRIGMLFPVIHRKVKSVYIVLMEDNWWLRLS